MNTDQLKTLFPNASPDFISRNTSAQSGQTAVLDSDTGKAPELERHLGDGAMGEVSVQVGASKRVLIRVESVRKRLLDIDNLCEKFVVDCCRYAGLVHGDSPATTQIEVCERKCEPGEEEHTNVQIYEVQT